MSRADGDLSLDQLAPYRGTSACEDRVRIIHVHPAPSKVEQANLASKNAMCLTRFLSMCADRGTGWKALTRRKSDWHPPQSIGRLGLT